MPRTFVGPSDDPDKYELVEQKSAGGEGEVWRGSIILDSVHVPVAVKRILARNDANRDEWRVRWQRQAEMLRSLQHPRVVQVRELFEGPEPHEWRGSDEATSSLYLVMNWADGPTLSEWVARNPQRDAMESTRLVGGLAEAIDYLHVGSSTGQSVLHRDIKPSNVIVTTSGPVLVDFGFVRGVGAVEPMTVVGSPAYMPPEAMNGEFTTASDLYSLGATAYFAIAGEAPTPNDVPAMRARLNAVKGLEGRADLHDHLLSMLTGDVSARPTSAIEWAQTLGAMSVVSGPVPAPPLRTAPSASQIVAPAPQPKKKRRRLPVMVGLLVLLAAAATTGFFLTRGDDESSTVGDEGGSEVPDADATDGPEQDDADQTEDEAGDPDVPEPVEPDVPLTISVPSLIGSTAEDARAQADELGFDLELTDVVRAGDPGVVLSQSPGAGIVLETGGVVSLEVSAIAVMPDVAQLGIDEATAELEAVDAVVRVVEEYDASGVPGTLVSQDPAPGAAVPTSVTITVVGEPASLYLERLTPVTSYRFETDIQAGIGGDTYAHTASLMAGGSGSGDGYGEYNLSRNFDELRTTLGYSDNSGSDGRILLEIFGDGRELYRGEFTLGTVVPLTLDVSDVLRLRFEATRLAYGNPTPYLMMGEVAVLGDPAVIDRYLAELSEE